MPSWILIALSIMLPLGIEQLFLSFFSHQIPESIYLLFLIPIIIFVFHYDLKAVLVGTLLVNIVHLLGGVYFISFFGGNAVDRFSNHIGLAMVSLLLAFTSTRLIKELRESEERYRSVIQISPQIIFIHQNQQIVYANPAAISAVGMKEESEVLNKSIFDFAHPLETETVVNRTNDIYNNQRGEGFVEYQFLRPDGEVNTLELLGTKINYYGKPAIMVVGKDITEQKKTLAKLVEREERYRSLFSYSPDAIVTLDLEGTFVSLNPQVYLLCGYDPEELIDKPFAPLVDINDLDKVLIEFEKALKGETINLEFKLTHKQGHKVYVHATTIPIKVKDQIVGAYCIVKDVSEQKEMQDRITYLAFHDELTGLPNRYMFNDTLQNALSQCEQNQQPLSVFFLDLDRFKRINDNLGHDMGDLLLEQVSQRLKQAVGEEGLVARQGGDEFILLLKGKGREDSETVAQKILNQFRDPFNLRGLEVYSSTSIGIALYPKDGKSNIDLIKIADTAMYRAKTIGRNTYSFYHSLYGIHNLDTLTLENSLRKAIREEELILHFQPKVELETGRIMGTEALTRWNHRKFGWIPPSEFIPIAEETGLIVPLGKLVLEKACRQNKEWQDKGYSDLVIAINVSVLQFKTGDIVKTISDVLEKTKLEPEYLLIEITESVLQDVEESKTIINRLGALGVRVSLDDFGTGYSSLSVLKHLPIHYLKIDKSFIDDINMTDQNIVKAIIEMGMNLNFELVAEGIETKEQADFLKQNGCHYGQGYFFSKPMLAEDIEKQLVVQQKGMFEVEPV